MQVFVAGATGRAGARIVRELLKAGFKVRAGARNVEAAEEAVQVAENYGLLTQQQIRNLQIVPFDLSQPNSMKAAIGGARKVRTGVVALCQPTCTDQCFQLVMNMLMLILRLYVLWEHQSQRPSMCLHPRRLMGMAPSS
jgi:NAD(P)-dependent dehydrogenase (short-subunit alcohol dehydrogenase family)